MFSKIILFICAIIFVTSEVQSETIVCDLEKNFRVNADVQSLLGSGRSCTIKNRRFNDYFYAAIGLDRDKDRRRVFTWVPGNYDHQSLWHLEKTAGDVYKIKSAEFDEYLYAGVNDFRVDSQRRDVFTWKPKTRCEEQCYWDIQLVRQPAGATDHYFTIRNVEYGEYLFVLDANQGNDPRRKVYTWKFDPHHNVQADQQSHWAINCE